jgi:GNAT superfamily N-acetyltransferase
VTDIDIAQLWRVFGSGLAVLNRCAPGSEIWLSAHSSLAMSGEPYADCNMAVIDAGGEPEATLTRFVGRLRERRLPALFNFSSAAAPGLRGVALHLGLEEAGLTPLMVLDAENPGRGTRVASRSQETMTWRVTDPSDLERVASVCGQAFDAAHDSMRRMLDPAVLGVPGLDIFLACAGGDPVSALATTAHGGYTGIWAMATSPPCQRRGYGYAALSFALDYHQETVVRFYLTASDAGRPLYEGLGFTTVEESPTWLLQAS